MDVVPKKVCSFDCVYCEVGRTTEKTVERKGFFDPDEILREFEAFLKENGEAFDVVTLSGSGEPTLYSHMGYLTSEIRKRTKKSICLLTNSSLLWMDDVLEEMGNFDVVLPSLDTCLEDTFIKVNRPHPSISLDLVKKGLLSLKEYFKGSVYLEILFVKGVNDSEREVEELKRFVDRLSPDKIHINTVFRPPPFSWVSPLSMERLVELKGVFGPASEICGEFKKGEPIKGEVEETILNALAIRPMTVDDVANLLGRPRFEALKFLDSLVLKGLLKEERHGDETFFRKVET